MPAIDLYTWKTPNGRKVSIMLEELGLEYRVHPIDISAGDQFKPAFLAISPNNKIPAIVDHAPAEGSAPRTMMESGAILLYLARKTGRLIPKDPEGYWRAVEWLMMQMGGVGPMLGQLHHFRRAAPGRAPYAEERYAKETRRIYGVLDRRLAEAPCLAGPYSIADIATWPWIARHDWQGVDLNDYPNLKRWYLAICARPAVQRGWNVPPSDQVIPMPREVE